MIYWSFISFSVALASGLFGFGGSSTPAAGLAQTLFFVFLLIAVCLAGVKVARDADGAQRSVEDGDGSRRAD